MIGREGQNGQDNSKNLENMTVGSSFKRGGVSLHYSIKREGNVGIWECVIVRPSTCLACYLFSEMR